VLLRARISLTARLVKTQRTKWKLNGYNSVLMMMREAAFYAEQTEIIADCITKFTPYHGTSMTVLYLVVSTTYESILDLFGPKTFAEQINVSANCGRIMEKNAKS
jgi:hypothetical protein